MYLSETYRAIYLFVRNTSNMNNYVFFLLNSSAFLDSLPVKKNSFYGTYGTRTDNMNSKNNPYTQSSL